MIILDTNVLSSLMHENADSRIQAWLDRQPVLSVWTTTITLYEIRFGIELLPAGQRRQALETAFRKILVDELNQQVLMFDNAAAEHAAALDAGRRKRGKKIDPRDTFIAGIALAQRARLATRNTKHFSDLKVPVVDPWAAS